MNCIFYKTKHGTPDLRKPFLLPHHGGEIWVVNIDSLGNNVTIVKEKILENEKMMNRPSMTAFVLYHLQDTDITYDVASFMMESLIRSKDFLKKLAFVGVKRSGRMEIDKIIKGAKGEWLIPVKFFSSLDEAKDWLVGVE